jgi:hypothetical protein
MNILFKKQAGSAELQRALDGIDLEALAAQIEKTEAERRALLLDGDDAAVLAVEERLAGARLARDRAEVRQDELRKRLAEAKRREQREALEVEHRAVSELADKTARSLRRDYIDAATKLVDVLTRLHNAEKAVYVLNQKLGEAGMLAEGLPLVKQVEKRVFDFGLSAARAVSICWNTALREFRLPNGKVDPSLPSWPPEGETFISG